MAKEIACKDCKHYNDDFALGALRGCRHPATRKFSIVYGESFGASPFDMRDTTGKCGPDGELFELLPPPPKRSSWWPEW